LYAITKVTDTPIIPTIISWIILFRISSDNKVIEK
jgi:hypothetical protein